MAPLPFSEDGFSSSGEDFSGRLKSPSTLFRNGRLPHPSGVVQYHSRPSSDIGPSDRLPNDRSFAAWYSQRLIL